MIIFIAVTHCDLIGMLIKMLTIYIASNGSCDMKLIQRMLNHNDMRNTDFTLGEKNVPTFYSREIIRTSSCQLICNICLIIYVLSRCSQSITNCSNFLSSTDTYHDNNIFLIYKIQLQKKPVPFCSLLVYKHKKRQKLQFEEKETLQTFK